MRRTIRFALTIFCLIFLCSLAGCNAKSSVADSANKVSMDGRYRKEDFRFIVVGESTFQDVCKVAMVEAMQITSYGGFCDYPLQKGGYIRIKFYGKNLIVSSIEEVPSST